MSVAHDVVTRRVRLSAAAINRYRVCEKQFHFADVLRPKIERSQPSAILAQANAVHHALERFYGLPTGQRHVEHLHRALRAVWSQYREGAFFGRDEEAFYGREAIEMLSAYAARADLTVQPLAREQRFQLTLTPQVTLVGKIDRIDSAFDPADPTGDELDTDNSSDSIEVVDWKTGRQTLESSELPFEPAVQVYVVAAERLFKKPVSKVRYVYLKGDDVDWVPGGRDEVEELKQRLLDKCDEIASATEYTAAPGRQCDWCRYALLCEERQRVELAQLVVPEGIPF